MPSSSTSGTVALVRSSSSSAVALPISPWTTTRCSSAPHLEGKASWFLPFNKGWNDGAGNPPNPNGLKTDYLWKQVLTRDGLTDIIENYAQDRGEQESTRRGARNASRYGLAITNWTWYAELLADVHSIEGSGS